MTQVRDAKVGSSSASETISALRKAFGAPKWKDLGIVAAFLALFIGLTIASPAFLTSTNLRNLLEQWAPIGIIACAGTLVIIAGGFDLSVGAIYAIAGVIAAKVTNSTDPAVGALAGIIAGLLIGTANGAVVTVGRINSFMATLASSIMISGFALALSGGFLVSVTDPGFTKLGRGEFLGLKYSVWLWIVIALVSAFALARSVYGRYIYSSGGNADAARLSGVPVNLIKASTFALSGMAAGLAGVIVASRSATGQADVGTGIELTVIASVVVGGTSILGGEGAIWRTILGVLIVAMIGNGFNLLNVDPVYRQVFEGAIILGAVGLDSWSRR
ncbi:MAG TPA: ABC transporter permease [Solirubrobacterales bacterium]|jgi:ribose transport system permease protein|nr:ABC transporter permease [Solirubrobacterales bacterium]